MDALWIAGDKSMSKKGATQSGGTAGRRRNKDAAMAAELKARGVQRTSMACPMCHHIISISGQQGHLVACKGRPKVEWFGRRRAA